MTIMVIAAVGSGERVLAAPGSACAARSAYPTFCAIPPAPRDVTGAAAVHAEVLDTRLAGRDVVTATAPSTFTLAETAGFARRAITEAAPPPPMTTPSEADAEAFARAARATAIPPKHSR